MSTPFSRREFLGYLALVGAGVGANTLAMRGMRIPLALEPRGAPHAARHPDRGFVVHGNGAFPLAIDEDAYAWRAFAPEPVLHIEGDFKVTLDNVHPLAALDVSGSGIISEEKVTGLMRSVTGNSAKGALTLRWRVPFAQSYRFAAIGDTGGDHELAWALQRAKQLGAQFLLHLGDLYYQPNDDLNVARTLSSAPLPTYAAIGNHDLPHSFDGELSNWFETNVGPRNTSFSLGGVQFINLDTAADTIPWSGGARGALLRQIPSLDDNPGIRDYVVFTHRPVTDLRQPKDQPTDHSIKNWGEDAWLHRELLRRGVGAVINGHIHSSLEKDDRGLRTFIAGEGLAHLDIVASQ
ncbi:MAG: hypothetical protein HON79_03805, partial [Acidiferrobacteraceae bacterium]|nr:hypothetical protein [Acidiferrobacteraceae bacterium]